MWWLIRDLKKSEGLDSIFTVEQFHMKDVFSVNLMIHLTQINVGEI